MISSDFSDVFKVQSAALIMCEAESSETEQAVKRKKSVSVASELG